MQHVKKGNPDRVKDALWAELVVFPMRRTNQDWQCWSTLTCKCPEVRSPKSPDVRHFKRLNVSTEVRLESKTIKVTLSLMDFCLKLNAHRIQIVLKIIILNTLDTRVVILSLYLKVSPQLLHCQQ